jgi:DNA-binding GntR family transcriptional regulator
LRAHLERVRRLLMTPSGRMQATLREHLAIFDRIGAGDAPGARAAMEAHLAQMSMLFETFAGERPALFTA